MYCNGNNLRGLTQYEETGIQAFKNAEFQKLRKSLMVRLPRVAPNQKVAYESDDLFRQLSTDKPVRYANHIKKDHNIRQTEFNGECHRGELTIAVMPMGIPLHLRFAGDQTASSSQETVEGGCNFYKEPGKVHITSSFIMNGVCVKFHGWFDLVTLEGMGRLEFDELNALKEYGKLFRLMGGVQLHTNIPNFT
ncbi:hypothetical protein HA402_002005 [Bradysia odoriphaga]|nr:hypothetical protein HA402_002005 [Bradysia odoriphaga]